MSIYDEIRAERERQKAKHGDQAHLPDGTGPDRWLRMDDHYLRRHGIRLGDLAEWAKARTDRAAQHGGDGSVTFEHILTEEFGAGRCCRGPVGRGSGPPHDHPRPRPGGAHRGHRHPRPPRPARHHPHTRGRRGTSAARRSKRMSEPYYADEQIMLHHGDALAVLRDMPGASVDCCVTSPPYYGLRDYGTEGQYGLEASPAEYVETMRALFAEVRRVLADDGTLWLNIGDSYCSKPGGPQGVTGDRASRTFTAEGMGWRPGSGGGDGRGIDSRGQRNRDGVTAPIAAKNLLGIPWRTALALQDDGWILRNEIIWAKPNAMPESAKDRLSGKHEHLFMFAKSPRYWFNLEAGPNPGDVWSIPTRPFAEAHFAVYPVALPERCILAGCKPNGTVLDPFSGSGTTGLAAAKHGRHYVGIDLSSDYLDLSLRTRLGQTALIEETA